MRVSKDAAPARFSGRRVLGGGVVAAIFASYALSAAVVFPEASRVELWEVLAGFMLGGTLGLLLAFPVCLLVIYPVTRFFECLGLTGYDHAALVGMTYGAVLASLYLAMMYGTRLGYGALSRTPDVYFLAEIAVPFSILAGVGVFSGLLARAVMGQARILDPEDV